MTRFTLSFRLTALAVPFLIGGCGLNDWANTHMPVIGERCENWQCFTQSGQEQSHLNEQARLHPAQNPQASDSPAPTPGGTTATAPTPSNANTVAPAMPLAPPAGPEGAYKYEPRAAPGPGSTPF